MVDLSEKAPYRIIDGTDGVRIVFGEAGEPAPAAHAPLASLRAPEPVEPEPAEPEPAPVAVARPVAIEPLALPPLPEPQAPASAPEPAAVPEQTNIGTACGMTGNLGTPISLDFKDGDLQDIFRLFSDISGLNVVVNPGVTGKVTLKLNEVPWGRALELILKTNRLGCVLEDNVIRIARAHRPAERGGGAPQAPGREGAGRRPHRLHEADLLREGVGAPGRPQEGRRAVARGARSTSTRGPTR